MSSFYFSKRGHNFSFYLLLISISHHFVYYNHDECEITTLVWGFIWGGGINQIDRKVCCLGVENGGMGMINIQEFIDSKRIKLLYRITFKICII
jgi:hypothetical protein